MSWEDILKHEWIDEKMKSDMRNWNKKIKKIQELLTSLKTEPPYDDTDVERADLDDRIDYFIEQIYNNFYFELI